MGSVVVDRKGTIVEAGSLQDSVLAGFTAMCRAGSW